IDPQLTVVKTAVSDTILYNSTANFTVTVTNTGDVNLTNVEVVDLDTPNCNNDAIGTLTVGQSTEYTCSFSNATVDIDATATATGTHQLGQINANDSAIVDVINPSIALSITPDEQQILSGDNVNFSVTVTNTGNVTLSNVVVTDTIVAGCAKNDIGSLAKDASTTYPCSDSSVTGDYFNNASVTADHTIGQVSDNTSALVDVFNANVDVSMTANTYALSGSNVTFNVLITNTSGTTMDNIQFDDTATGCSFVVSTLADGAHHNANCVKSGATIDLNNTAYVTGTLPSGDVSSSDVAVVDVIDPDINISITPGTQEVDVGETATFTVTVENTGDRDLTNVNVSSTAVSDCNTSIDTTLTAGTDTTHTYTCEVSSASVELDNKVTVVGSHPIGTVTANETAVLELGTSYIFLPLIIK
ncbi:MAG: DUF11 domain-containing protein, partial [Chloroflexi bacterium]|nr:DUF11 domain-containing protein [Chloroflexota bacterium]